MGYSKSPSGNVKNIDVISVACCRRTKLHKSTGPERNRRQREHFECRSTPGGHRLSPQNPGNPALFGDQYGTGECYRKKNWRRDRDSNPGYAFTHTRFPSVRLKPLGHLSASRDASIANPDASANPDYASIFNAAKNADWGISTLPNWRIRFLPSFCFSSSFRLRLISPP